MFPNKLEHSYRHSLPNLPLRVAGKKLGTAFSCEQSFSQLYCVEQFNDEVLAQMDVYKLQLEHTGAKKIDRDTFEKETRCREPWYQDGSRKRSQFAVCPACDNPIQLVGLYELPKNLDQPYGKHTTTAIQGIGPSDVETRECCPYFKPRQHEKTARKKGFEGTPRKILTLLIEQFDRVAYIIEKQINVALSAATLRGMLERYKGERGYMYTGATLRNIPWIFAYMSDATDLFGQRVAANEALAKAISDSAPGATINENGRLAAQALPSKKTNFVDIKMSFIRHRFHRDSEAGPLEESMELVISQSCNRELMDIHSEKIEFDHAWFERLVQLPVDHKNRRMDRVALAREVLGSLL